VFSVFLSDTYFGDDIDFQMDLISSSVTFLVQSFGSNSSILLDQTQLIPYIFLCLFVVFFDFSNSFILDLFLLSVPVSFISFYPADLALVPLPFLSVIFIMTFSLMGQLVICVGSFFLTLSSLGKHKLMDWSPW
jgi:hypothetical protein